MSALARASMKGPPPTAVETTQASPISMVGVLMWPSGRREPWFAAFCSPGSCRATTRPRARPSAHCRDWLATADHTGSRQVGVIAGGTSPSSPRIAGIW